MDYADFAAYGRVLLKYLWLILILVVVTVAGTYYVGKNQKPIYHAAVTLQIVSFESEDVTLFGQPRTLPSTELVKSTRNGFSAVATSRSVLLKTINELGLNTTPENLLQHVSIGGEEAVDFVSVNVDAQTSQDAASIANKLVETALAQYRADRGRDISTKTDFIQGQVNDAEAKLAGARNNLLKFKLSNNIDSLARQLTALQEQVAQLHAQRDQANLEIAKAEASATFLEKQAQDSKAKMDEAAAANLTTSTEFYRGQLANFAGQAAAQRSTAIGQKALIDTLSQTISQREADMTALLGLSVEAQRLEDAVKEAQDQRDSLNSKLSEANIKRSQALTGGYLQVVDPARTPQAPQQANVTRLVEIAGGAALLVGIALAFILEWFSLAGHARRQQALVRHP